MTDEQKAQRMDELAKRIAYANALGVRAEVVGDAEQRAEAARIYTEAMEELRRLEGDTP
jgi:hypothetical protein